MFHIDQPESSSWLFYALRVLYKFQVDKERLASFILLIFLSFKSFVIFYFFPSIILLHSFKSCLNQNMLIYHRLTFYTNRAERSNLLLQQPDVITTSIEEVSSSTRPVVRQLQKLPKRFKKLIAMLPHQEACWHFRQTWFYFMSSD